MRRKLLWSTLMLILCVMFAQAASAEITAMKLSRTKASMRAGKTATLGIQVKPKKEKANVVWSSSDESVAVVSANGKIRALKSGTAVITATAKDAGALTRSCTLTVKPAVITKLTLSHSSMTLSLGDEPANIAVAIAPAAGEASQLTWSSSNTRVVTVGSEGITPVGVGTAKITVKAPSGKKAQCTVKVTATSGTRRAIVIGESRARREAGYELTELPMVSREVSDVAKLFSARGIKTATAYNKTRAQLLSSIEAALAGAREGDTSYVYIICHGGMFGSTYRLFPCGDGYVTPAQLRSVLDRVPGNVVLMLGSCYSGSVISKSDEARSFIDAFTSVTGKAGEFVANKYQVLCAASQTELGYGVISRDRATGRLIESQSYNFFGKAVTEGLSGDADANGDKAITLAELYSYTHRRVNSLYAYWQPRIDGLSAKDTQTVVCYPTGSSFVVF